MELRPDVAVESQEQVWTWTTTCVCERGEKAERCLLQGLREGYHRV